VQDFLLRNDIMSVSFRQRHGFAKTLPNRCLLLPATRMHFALSRYELFHMPSVRCYSLTARCSGALTTIWGVPPPSIFGYVGHSCCRQIAISRKSSRMFSTNRLVEPIRATQSDYGRGAGIGAWEAVLQLLSHAEYL
jgi:hypothetical protein